MQNRNQPDQGSDTAPDTARSYERAKPEKEAGAGRLDNNDATPTDDPGQLEKTVPNRQDPQRQINADESGDDRSDRPLDTAETAPHQPEHSMLEEEPMGWDQAPQNIADPRQKRHSRTEGRGGLD